MVRVTRCCAVLVALASSVTACSFPEYATVPVDRNPDGALDTRGSSDSEGADTANDTLSIDSNNDVTDEVGGDASDATDVAEVATKTCAELMGSLHAGHCYWGIATVEPQSVAKKACADAGGHLVTIGDSAENAFFLSISIATARWIGLQAPGPSTLKTDYLWITGEPKPYENWAVGAPSGTGGCVRMIPTTGQWGDRRCGLDMFAAICERDSP